MTKSTLGKPTVSNVNQVIDHATASCQANGSKLTEKRKRVLTGLLVSGKALSAYDLIEYLRTEYGEAPPPTSVYRILDFLSQENLVHKLQLANKYVACSHIACDHKHQVPQFLICGECGKVTEIGIEKSTMDSLKTSVKKAGYVLKGPQMELLCLCQECTNIAA